MLFLDAVKMMADNATGFSKVFGAKNLVITLMGPVNKENPYHLDFNLLDPVIVSLPAKEFYHKYRGMDIDQVMDLDKHDYKVVWSPEPLTGEEGDVFKTELVCRMIDYAPESDIANFVALRNKYGSSLVELPIIIN